MHAARRVRANDGAKTSSRRSEKLRARFELSAGDGGCVAI